PGQRLGRNGWGGAWRSGRRGRSGSGCARALCGRSGHSRRRPRRPTSPTGLTDEPSPTGGSRVGGEQPASQNRGPAESLLKSLARCIDRGLDVARDALAHVGLYAQALQAVDSTLRPSATATSVEREAQFSALQQEWQSSAEPVEQHFAKMMSGFALGL